MCCNRSYRRFESRAAVYGRTRDSRTATDGLTDGNCLCCASQLAQAPGVADIPISRLSQLRDGSVSLSPPQLSVRDTVTSILQALSKKAGLAQSASTPCTCVRHAPLCPDWLVRHLTLRSMCGVRARAHADADNGYTLT
jgi:hypothetical protein